MEGWKNEFRKLRRIEKKELKREKS